MKNSVAETTEQTTICEHSTQKLNHSKKESFLRTNQNPSERSLVVVVVVAYYILSRLLYLAYSANLGLLCTPHPGMGPLV